MDESEAHKVLESVQHDMYPPTNPAVLLSAAKTLYLAHEPHAGIREILRWTLTVMVQNDSDVPESEHFSY